MFKKNSVTLINLLLVLSILLAACGGGDKNAEPTRTQPSPTEASLEPTATLLTEAPAPTATLPSTEAPLPTATLLLTEVPVPSETPKPTDTPQPQAQDVTVNALFYFTKPDGSPGGGTSPARIEVRPSASTGLRVGFFEEEVGGSGPMWRSAGWMAVTLGSMLLGKDPADFEFSFSVGGQVDGPSAGALMTVAVLAALRGETVRENSAMTGTIQPDGTVGPVGGIPHKVQGAAEAGKTFILIPAGQRFSEDYGTGEFVDVIELGRQHGAEVHEVSTIYEAYELLTGSPLPRPEVSRAQPQLPSRAFDRMEAKAKEWYSRYLDERNQFNTKPAWVQEAFAEDILYVEAQAAASDSVLLQGLPTVAYQRAVEAAAQMRLYNLVGDVYARYSENGLDDAVHFLNAAAVAESELDAVISLLQTEEPASVSDYVALFDAYSEAGMAEGLILLAQEGIQNLLANAASMTEDEILTSLLEATNNYTLARLFIQLTRDSTDLYLGFGVTPAPSQEDVFALAETLRRASEANLGYFESAIVDQYAQAYGTHTDIMRNRFMSIEPDYLMATASNVGIRYLQTKIGSGSESGSLVMGHSLNAYSLSSQLIAKWDSLDAQMDEAGEVYWVGRERALADMLNLAEARALELINLNGDEVPVPAIFYYENARIYRQGTTDEQIDALGYYWQAAILAETAAYLTGKLGE